MADKKKSTKEEILDRAQDQMNEESLESVEEVSAVPSAGEVSLVEGDGNGEDFDKDDVDFREGEVFERSIVQELKANYLDYSMSVIISRAIPESKDGLKPSQRRVMVAMNDLALGPTAHYKKSAKIAGATSGDYHPHGESVVYPTMVKLAQDFATRYMLVDGQGNFGSIDGDMPAAMRYTEARMTKIAGEMLKDLDKGTVTFVPNYDGTKLEPTVLPTLFPNLICNGSDGIAVGMATKIPPHNLTEVVTALREMIKLGNSWKGKAIYNELRIEKEKGEVVPQVLNGNPLDYYERYINNNELNKEEKAEEIRARLKDEGEKEEDQVALYPKFESDINAQELIKIIPGPDFPTGAIIYDQKEIINAYATGRGRILMRAKAAIEEGANGRMHIVVTEIPYQVNKSYLIAKIADLVKEKKIEGIADIRDESSLKDGMRIVVILKKDQQPKAILNNLYKFTQMQMAYNANMISIVEQEPQTLSLKRMLELFLSFRFSVTIRRYEFDLAAARYRGHILEGLLKALDILDEIIDTIRKSKTQEDSKTNLITKFKFTEVQAQAILDMQLRRLAALEREKLQNEFKEVSENIKEYNKILNSEQEVLKVMDQDLALLLEKHGDERRTKVIKGRADELSEEDLVANEQTFVTISHQGYIKRISPDAYKLQKRGGKGVVGATTKEDDYVEHAFSCNTHDELLLFSNKGRVFRTKVFEIPEYNRTAKGLPLVNLIQLEQNELVTSVLTQGKEGIVLSEDEIQEGQAEIGAVKPEKFKYLFMATKLGTVKKTEISDFDNIRSNGLIAVKLDSGDELKWVSPTTGNNEIMLVTANGKAIKFHEKDVRPTGRNTRGVMGIRFKGDDQIVGMNPIRSNEDQMFTVSEYGYGKMTKLTDYPTQTRGGSGVFTFRVKDKTGKVIVARVMDHPDKEIVVISEHGQVIRSSVEAIPTLSRQTSGVKVMTMRAGDKVAALAIL